MNEASLEKLKGKRKKGKGKKLGRNTYFREGGEAMKQRGYVNKPYGGLFGNSVQVNAVEEIVADPYSNYRPKDLEEIIGASPPAIRRALGDLTALGLLKKDLSDAQHPVYHPNLDSKKIVALTFLAYAMTDDREGTDLMNTAIVDYYIKNIRPRVGLSEDLSERCMY